MADDDDFDPRKAPSSQKGWLRVNEGVRKAEKMWPFLSPFVAVADNWKALAIVLALVSGITYLTRPDIAAAVRLIIGGAP